MKGKHVKIGLDTILRSELEKFSKTGKRRVRLVNRAKIILERNEANGRNPLTQWWIALKVGVSRQTVNDAKRAFISAASISVTKKVRNATS
jgi:pyrroloquinoline quinone (PQQ) biosynthesis protein C